MAEIDFTFISQLEGGQKLVGYVPAASVSKSGVTVATGFDLGARNESDLKSLGITDPLLSKLKPYLGKQGKDAKDFLRTSALRITKLEADKIDKAAKSKIVDSLKSKWNAASKTKFNSLFAEAQTVVASVAFQYGTNLKTKTPNFWKQITACDWEKAIANLENFGDSYTTRRKKEAKLLKRGWVRETSKAALSASQALTAKVMDSVRATSAAGRGGR